MILSVDHTVSSTKLMYDTPSCRLPSKRPLHRALQQLLLLLVRIARRVSTCRGSGKEEETVSSCRVNITRL